jgi:hypothetical protein
MQNEGDVLDVILLYMPGTRMELRLEGNIQKYAEWKGMIAQGRRVGDRSMVLISVV